MKLTKRQDTILGWIFCSLLFGFVLYLAFVRSPKIEKEIEEYGCYTYCITYKKKYFYHSGRHVLFKYKYKGKEYEGREFYKKGMNINGGVYLIRVSTKNPEHKDSYLFEGEIDTNNVAIRQLLNCN